MWSHVRIDRPPAPDFPTLHTPSFSLPPSLHHHRPLTFEQRPLARSVGRPAGWLARCRWPRPFVESLLYFLLPTMLIDRHDGRHLGRKEERNMEHGIMCRRRRRQRLEETDGRRTCNGVGCRSRRKTERAGERGTNEWRRTMRVCSASFVRSFVLSIASDAEYFRFAWFPANRPTLPPSRYLL